MDGDGESKVSDASPGSGAASPLLTQRQRLGERRVSKGQIFVAFTSQGDRRCPRLNPLQSLEQGPLYARASLRNPGYDILSPPSSTRGGSTLPSPLPEFLSRILVSGESAKGRRPTAAKDVEVRPIRFTKVNIRGKGEAYQLI